MSDHHSALAAVPLFAQLGTDRLHRLARCSVSRSVGAGTVLARHGERADQLIVAEAGTLVATRDTADGQRLRLGEFAGPCAVDKTAVLDGRGYTATWTAGTRAQVRLVPAAEFLSIVEDVPAARRHVLARLAESLRNQQDDLVRARSADATTRVAAWLIRAASRSGARVLLPGAQQGLAETVGASRVTVNRALRGLARDGLIRVEPGVVVILAPELLARRC